MEKTKQNKRKLYLDVPKTTIYCCKETRCCLGLQYVCQACGLSDNNACVKVSVKNLFFFYYDFADNL